MEETFEGKWYTHPHIRNPLIAGFLSAVAFSLARFGIVSSFVEIGIYLIAILLGGYHWAREGIEELLREREVGIDILMLAAAVGSAILGMWDEAAFLIFLYGIAEGLEEYTYARTRASIRKLLDLAPKEARVLKEGKEKIVPAQTLKVGDIFIVRPGESIPTDGIIVKGRASINEAPVTGESMPVEKKEGMKVFAATINQNGVLEVKATATFEDNTLSKIVHLVEEAQEQKGNAQLFIEKFGRKYSPLVLFSALLMVLVPFLVGASVSFWATRAVVLLVAAAPCALVMSTPVAIAAGIGRAGRSGVLIKGGIHLENLGRIKVVAFDKTGTLTRGEPVVTDIIPIEGDIQYLLGMAYSIEKNSEHPLARAIVKKAEETGIELLNASDFSSVSGYGTKASINQQQILIGRQELFGGIDIPADLVQRIRVLRNEGKTVVFLGTNKKIYGLFAIRDEIRPQAKEVVKELHHMNIKVCMLTGDNEMTAKAIAKEVGIDEVRAELKPENKVLAVKDLEARYGAIAMVGDGINDAPALAHATVGIAMGAAGTDAAIEAADVALMGDDLSKVPYAISIGKKARKISLQNIVFSLVVLVVLVPAALSGIMNVAGAVFLHEASELLAIANGLRVAHINCK